MRIRLNGETHDLPDGLTLLQLLERLGLLKPNVPLRRQGLAVERNREVVPSSQFAETPLRDGDALEIVTAFPGG
jgi:sulfur carrier protein